MTMGSWIWLIEIEGLGRDNRLVNDQFSITPMALTTQSWPTNAAYAGGVANSRICDEWQEVIQPESVTLSAMSYSPFAQKPGAQSLSFDIALPDARPEIERYFLSNPQPVANITAQIDPTDNTILMDTTAALTAGDIIYIGAECFRVAVVNSATLITVNQAIIGGSSTNGPDITWPYGTRLNVGTRTSNGAVGIIGAFGSRVAIHEVPQPNEIPPFPDTRVYLANPRVKGRRVYLRRVSWGLNGSGVEGYREQLFGQYVIRDVTVNANGTTISVSAGSLVANYEKAQLGARGVSDRLQVYRGQSGSGATIIDLDNTPGNLDRRIWKDNTVCYSNGSEANLFVGISFAFIAILNGETFHRAIQTTRSLGLKSFTPVDIDSESTEPEFIRFISKETGQKVKEVLISDPLKIILDTSGNEALYPLNPNSHPYYSTDKPGGAGILEHPLHLMLAHLGQLNSNLPYHWQLRLDTQAVAKAAILQYAEQLVINEWPGVCVTGPVKAMEWLAKTFLQPLACGFVTDEFGRLSVASVTMLRPSPWGVPKVFDGFSSTNNINESVLAPGRQVQRIVEVEAGVTQSITGQGLGKEPRITIQSADAYKVADGEPENTTFQIDAMGAFSPDNETENGVLLDIIPIMFMRSLTSTIGTFLRAGAIQYTLRIPSGFPDEEQLFQPYGDTLAPAMPSRYALPGTSVTIDAIVPGLRKLAGPRLAIVLEHKWEDNCATQQIRVLDIGELIKIAPAGRVVSASVVSGDLNIVLEPDFEVIPVPYNVPPFGAITEDGQTLSAFASTAGDYEFVRFYDETLADRNPGPSNAEQVVSYNIATNTLTTNYSASYIPVAGDFVLLAELGEGDVDDFYAFMGRNKFNL
jgi:hypothetical protein